MDRLLASIAEKKAELDRQRARAPAGLRTFEHAQDLELTYTSNAIEGNTLTARETALVVENGITVGGKPLKDHLEAIDHFGALQYVRGLARETQPIIEADVRNLHRLVMLRSDPDNGGQYATGVRYVDTDAGKHFFPTPAEIPARMGDFAKWLAAVPVTPEAAFRAHRELVSIHPFDDGNGRTGRLLMNLVLIRSGYPPVAVRPQDRVAYLDALQQADQGQPAAFDRLLCERLDVTLGEYVSASKEALSSPAAASRRSEDKPAP